MTLAINQLRQLAQLRRHEPQAARRIDQLLDDGYTDAARRKLVAAMKRLLIRLSNPTPPLPEAAPDQEWDNLPRTPAESIQAMLGQDYLADRERLAQPTRIRKPTAEEAQRALDAVLRPGGGGPVHRPRYTFNPKW